MKFAVLWTGRSGYFDACLRALNALGGQVLLVHWPPGDDAPFALPPLDIDQVVVRSRADDAATVRASIERFSPDALIMSAWHDRTHREVMRSFAGRAVRVVAMDNQWRASPKQLLGVATSRVYVRPLFDAALVPGDRQRAFARRLGFRQDRIWQPLYSADTAAFERIPAEAGFPGFFYVGRLAPEKGIAVLLDAHRLHVARHARPWPLHLYGTGPLAPASNPREFVHFHGFRQPEELIASFAAHACFVLPSRFEPWGVVVHEAATAARPIIATAKVGATPDLVRDGYNGYVVESSPEQLAGAMDRMASLELRARTEMGRRSRSLATHITPRLWAEALMDNVRHLATEVFG